MRFIVTPNQNPGGSSVYVVDTLGEHAPTWRANAEEAERYAAAFNDDGSATEQAERDLADDSYRRDLMGYND